jgi:hypothetical protein
MRGNDYFHFFVGSIRLNSWGRDPEPGNKQANDRWLILENIDKLQIFNFGRK